MFQVKLKQPQERMLRQKQADTQGQQLPSLQREEQRSAQSHMKQLQTDRTTENLLGSTRLNTTDLKFLCEDICPRPPAAEDTTNLQRSWVSQRPSQAGLLDELTEQLVLELRVGQAHLQGTLGQRDVVIDGRSVDGHLDEELAGLRGGADLSPLLTRYRNLCCSTNCTP